MTRVVFLDFDGVIATEADYQRANEMYAKDPLLLEDLSSTEIINPELVANVQELCDRAGASVVLSTSWRFHYPTQLPEMLKARGFTAPIIGQTLDWRSQLKMSQSMDREDEIMDWLDDNHVDEFVVLDDEQMYTQHIKERWVQSDFETGFTKEHLVQALKLFGITVEQTTQPEAEVAAKYTYKIEVLYGEGWKALFEVGLEWGRGYLAHHRDTPGPSLAYRLIRNDGKVIEETPGKPMAGLGLIAGWPSAEQYRKVAQECLKMAENIEAAEARREARRKDKG